MAADPLNEMGRAVGQKQAGDELQDVDVPGQREHRGLAIVKGPTACLYDIGGRVQEFSGAVIPGVRETNDRESETHPRAISNCAATAAAMTAGSLPSTPGTPIGQTRRATLA